MLHVHLLLQCTYKTVLHDHIHQQLALDTRAVASVTQIPIYGIPTDDYVSFKLLIAYVFVPAVLL